MKVIRWISDSASFLQERLKRRAERQKESQWKESVGLRYFVVVSKRHFSTLDKLEPKMIQTLFHNPKNWELIGFPEWTLYAFLQHLEVAELPLLKKTTKTWPFESVVLSRSLEQKISEAMLRCGSLLLWLGGCEVVWYHEFVSEKCCTLEGDQILTREGGVGVNQVLSETFTNIFSLGIFETSLAHTQTEISSCCLFQGPFRKGLVVLDENWKPARPSWCVRKR